MEGFPRNSREITQIVGRQNIGTCTLKDQTLKKTRTLLFPEMALTSESAITITRFRPSKHCDPEVLRRPETLKNSKDPKVTFKVPANVTQELPHSHCQSDSRVVLFDHFRQF